MPAQKVVPGSLIPTVPSAIASYETTSKNTESSGKVEVATFAHGCFWGTQEVFDKYFGPTRGVKTTVGYTGGEEKFKNPTYRQSSSTEPTIRRLPTDKATIAEPTEIARKVTEEVQAKHFTPKGLKIVTAIDDAGTWYDAEAYHQKYLEENPDGYHCSTHILHW
ncbi:Peptide-methionine (S)-S-oxide reductase [Tulasnella sp. UAMH 9824]|nr:Peptide-methionine (S)-S-oxide reductase [Tulasnella sp. UAMH 9824]